MIEEGYLQEQILEEIEPMESNMSSGEYYDDTSAPGIAPSFSNPSLTPGNMRNGPMKYKTSSG